MKLININNNTFQFYGNHFIYTNKERALLIKAAEKSQSKTSRICMHNNPNEDTQNMIICIMPHQEFRTHMHPLGKSESYTIIEGILNVDIFDSNKKFKVFIVKTKALTKDDSGYKEDEPGYDGLNTFQVIYTSNPDLSNWPNIKRLYELQRICHTVPFSEKAECKDKADLDESFLFWTFKKNIIREMPDLEKTTTTPQ